MFVRSQNARRIKRQQPRQNFVTDFSNIFFNISKTSKLYLNINYKEMQDHLFYEKQDRKRNE